MSVIAREAWEEFRFGLRSGVVALILVGLTGYLLMVLTHAGYLREMGAADIPRNAPSLVYLMTSGDAFFLLFAWAWVFAQPITRDRSAQLHELVLAAPVSLRALLIGRFFGATGVALLLGSSQLLGFILAPALEWVGAVPSGSMAETPWAAMGWATLVIALPSALGCGAIYSLLAMRTRSLVGPFVGASALMMCWMLAMIVLKEGHSDPFWSTMLDPSLFAESETQVNAWTPAEKSHALLALTPRLLVNRLVWCVLPLLVFAVAVWRAQREQLVLERPPRQNGRPWRGGGKAAVQAAHGPFPAASRWLAAMVSEIAWQCGRTLNHKGIWVAFAVLVVIGIGAGFVHGVGHAEGPMVPRPEFIAPQLLKSVYLLVAFVVAAAAGLVARRDHVRGFDEMLDASAAPEWVRMAGRAAAVLAVAALFSLAPGLSGLALSLMAAPSNTSPLNALVYPLVVMLPAMLEMAAMMALIHAVVRPAGPAYAASLLVAFVFIVNHETDLVSYPPAEIAIPIHLQLSGLTGWAPWAERLLVGDAWKFALATLMLCVGMLAVPRGTDGRLRVALQRAVRRVAGPIGGAALLSVVALLALGRVQQQRFVEQGGHRGSDDQIADNAAWERRWAARAGAFTVAGGEMAVVFDSEHGEANGRWELHGVKAPGGLLHAELPLGLTVREALVEGQPVQIEQSDDHAGIPLGACATSGCTVVLSWRVSAQGWQSEGHPHWMQAGTLFARATDVAPRLGLDRDRVVRARSDRLAHGLPEAVPTFATRSAVPAVGIAPAGSWRWVLRRDAKAEMEPGMAAVEGRTQGPLDFVALWLPQAERSTVAGKLVLHDASRQGAAAGVAADLVAMGTCVERRFGRVPKVSSVVQMPRGTGKPDVIGDRLLLPENPSWDVADKGTGRWMRRAQIASALARAQMVHAADLRGSEGAPVLSEALAGAIGLLCVGDADGVPALEALLVRGADTTTQALAASKTPVGRVDEALSNSWLDAYGPLAFLAHAATMRPSDFSSLLSAAREEQDLKAFLRTRLDDRLTGVPNAADVRMQAGEGATHLATERWSWQSGGWSPASSTAAAVVLSPDAQGHLRAEPWPAADAVKLEPSRIVLAPHAYERAPKDNRISSAR